MGNTKFEEITTGRGEDLVTLTRWVIAQQQVHIYIFIFYYYYYCDSFHWIKLVYLSLVSFV